MAGGRRRTAVTIRFSALEAPCGSRHGAPARRRPPAPPRKPAEPQTAAHRPPPAPRTARSRKPTGTLVYEIGRAREPDRPAPAARAVAWLTSRRRSRRTGAVLRAHRPSQSPPPRSSRGGGSPARTEKRADRAGPVRAARHRGPTPPLGLKPLIRTRKRAGRRTRPTLGKRLLSALALPSEAPVVHPARGPPELFEDGL